MGVIEDIRIVVLGLFGIYVLIWAIPCSIYLSVISLGDVQRIVFIDKQLSKNVEKLHSDSNCMFFTSKGTRFMGYCILYPFIRHRATTKSKKFKFMMWSNCLCFWGFGMILLRVCIKEFALA